MMRILITGSRDWVSRHTVEQAIKSYSDDSTTIVHGACPTGADLFAAEFAESSGFTVEAIPAQWGKYGKAAGPHRNRQMVDLGADICLAFIRNGSKGATGTARMAVDAGIEVVEFIEKAGK